MQLSFFFARTYVTCVAASAMIVGVGRLNDFRYRRQVARIKRQTDALRTAERRRGERWNRRSWSLHELYLSLARDASSEASAEAMFWEALAHCGFYGDEREELFRREIVMYQRREPIHRIAPD